MAACPETDDLRLQLAELFFLDTEFTDRDFDRVAASLRAAGWDRARTINELIDHIAPIVGGNLGGLIYPVIGAWAGFDADHFHARMAHQVALRAKHPRWWFFLRNRHSAWMLRQLNVQKLLQRL